MKTVIEVWREFKASMVTQNIYLLFNNGVLRHERDHYKKAYEAIKLANAHGIEYIDLSEKSNT